MESGYNVWNYTINRITFKRGKEIDEQLSRAEWQIHFRQARTAIRFFPMEFPCLKILRSKSNFIPFRLGRERGVLKRGWKKVFLVPRRNFIGIDACLRCTDVSSPVSTIRFDVFSTYFDASFFPKYSQTDPFPSMLRRDNLSWPLSTLEIEANPGGYLKVTLTSPH